MKKRLTLSLLLLAIGILLLAGCSAPYKDDARIGTYTALGPDGKSIAYRLTLDADGEGVITRYPTVGPEESEDIIFTIDDGDVLVLHGTEQTGGVVGRNEYMGTFILEGDAYAFELRSADTGVPLALFTQEK